MEQTTNKIRICQVQISRKPSALADISLEIHSDLGVITLNDCRILRNRQNEAWFSLPTYSVSEGKSYTYAPAVVLSPSLKQQVTVAALTAFENWEKSQEAEQQQPAAVNGGLR